MKKRYTEEQIIKAIKQHEAGSKVENLCREMGISVGTFYNWRSKYAGLEVNEAKRLKELETENNRLKKMLADKMLEIEAMRDVLSKKCGKKTCCSTSDGSISPERTGGQQVGRAESNCTSVSAKNERR